MRGENDWIEIILKYQKCVHIVVVILPFSCWRTNARLNHSLIVTIIHVRPRAVVEHHNNVEVADIDLQALLGREPIQAPCPLVRHGGVTVTRLGPSSFTTIFGSPQSSNSRNFLTF